MLAATIRSLTTGNSLAEVPKPRSTDAAPSSEELADADELSPDGGKAGGNQHDRRIVAEHAAHAAHVGAIGAELAVTGCIENAGQDQQYYSSKIHRRLLRDAGCIRSRGSVVKKEFLATRGANRW